MKKIFNLTPPVQIELQAHSLIGDVHIRIDAGADGIWEGIFDFFRSNGTWDEHLMYLLQAAGRTEITSGLQARVYMQGKTKAQIEAEVMGAWNEMLLSLAIRVNQLWKKATTPGTPTKDFYEEPLELFTALFARTQATMDAAGNAVFTAQ